MKQQHNIIVQTQQMMIQQR